MFASQENLVGLAIHHVHAEYLEQRIGFGSRHLLLVAPSVPAAIRIPEE